MPRKNSIKDFRGSFTGGGDRSSKVRHLSYGIKALGSFEMSEAMIKTCKLLLAKVLKENGFYIMKSYADRMKTKKPEKSRMGKGKGRFDKKVSYIKAGKILFELESKFESKIHYLFKQISVRLPVKIRLERLYPLL